MMRCTQAEPRAVPSSRHGRSPARRRSPLRARAASSGVSLLALFASVPSPGAAQFTLRDLVISGGASVEGYQGNLPAVSVPVLDSTEVVSAFAAEFAVRTDGSYRTGGNGTLAFSFDGGVRQIAARGFRLDDYAPREWVGTLDLGYSRALGDGAGILARARGRGREVQDRPPMPLFLQPGYRSGEVGVTLDFDGPGGIVYDLDISASKNDFMAPAFAPQVRLLDRDGLILEAGATLRRADGSTLRLATGLEGSRYPKQTTFDPEDPYRRDRTYHGAAVWSRQTDYLLQLAVEGRVNRSNSNRPEYDAVTVRGLVTAPLPHDLLMTAYGALTAKRYVHPSEFARLLPGEEANNASLAYVSVSRSLARNLDGTLRIGWTRAETEIGDAYFQRFGGTFLLHFRPRR
jgi:hypothetical protein